MGTNQRCDKMEPWAGLFRYDPFTPLLVSCNEAILCFVQKDLLDRDMGAIDKTGFAGIGKILKSQQPEGFWRSSKKQADTGVKYEIIETWRNFRYLIDQYRLDRTCPAVEKAAEYLLSCQSEEGDIRGILCNQYAPYYTGAIMYLLIKAGYADDSRIEKGVQWLLNMRQDDGGWLIGSPGMVNRTFKEVLFLTSAWTEEPERDFDKSRPFSAAGTGMAIRALAVHPAYQKCEAAQRAAFLLCSKFFKEDNWSWYKHPDNWVRFQFPYWWNHLVSALDMVSLIGLSKDEENIKKALDWLIENQQVSGLWKISYSSIHKNSENAETQLWISLCILRIFKRFYA